MVFVSKKKINKRDRYYLEESVRLPSGKVKKYSLYLKNYKLNKSYDLYSYKIKLKDKIKKDLIKINTNLYTKSYIFNNKTIEKLEEIKINYKELIKKISKKQWQDIFDRFTVNFTYESNAIEGNSLTLKEVTMILQEKKAIKGKDLREIYETINTREAIELIFKNNFKINEKDIIRLHKILVKNTGVEFGYKKLPNFLIGRNVKTISPENVEKEMRRIIKEYYNNKNMHPLEKTAIFHGKFEKIHPFEDGNGRVGRLLVNIMLLQNSYPPLIIRKSQRISYFNTLGAFDHGHKNKLFRFLIEKYKNTYNNFFEIYIKYLE